MADNRKDSWREVGTGLGHAFRDLGKTLLRGGATVVKQVEEMVDDEIDKFDTDEHQTNPNHTAEPVYSEDASENAKKANESK